MPVRLRESDYHEINASYELLRKGAVAFFGLDFIVFFCAFILVVASGGWPGLMRATGLWTFLLGLFIFIGFVTLALVPFMNWMWGGAHLARANRIEVRESARTLAFFVITLYIVSTVPVLCGFLIFFFTGSKLVASIIILSGTVAKIPVFPKRNILEGIVRASRKRAGIDIDVGNGLEHPGRHPNLQGAQQVGNGEVEVPVEVRKRLIESRDRLESVMESGKYIPLADESGNDLSPHNEEQE